MKTSALVLWILFLIIFSFVIASCDYESTVNIAPTQKGKGIKTNQLPTLAYIKTASDTVAVCDSLELMCNVEDPENDSCSYEWDSFKVTEESTEEDYEFDYFMNKGGFIQTGKTALWEPGKLDGKYLLLCIASDKAGNEISAKKIVNVNFNNCLSLTTDTTVYKPLYLDELNTSQLKLKIINNTKYGIIPRSDANFFIEGILKKDDGNWINYLDYQTTSSSITLETGEEILQESWPPINAGIFRFFVPYKLEANNPVFTDTLYSNEFKVVK
jgi:hypothetical protein